MTARRPRTAARRDEDGLTIPLVALSLVFLLTCVALAIDVGRIAVTNRELQRYADLASLDAVSALNGSTCATSYTVDGETAPTTLHAHVVAEAARSLARNGSTPTFVASRAALATAAGRAALVELGNLSTDATPVFTPLPAACSSVPDAVRVSVADDTGYTFGRVAGLRAQRSVRASTAQRAGIGAFTIGSTVLSLDSARSATLDNVLSRTLCRTSAPCSVTLGLVGYQGLAAGKVDLRRLAVDLGFAGPDELLRGSVALGTLLRSAAAACDTSSCRASLDSVATTLQTSSTNASQVVTIGRIATGSTGGDSAAGITISALDLLSGSAQAVNGSAAVEIPNLTATVPGVSSTSLKMNLVQAPRTYVGAVGGSTTTGQVDLTVTPTLNVTLLPGVSLVGPLPIRVTGGQATGTLRRATCEGSAQGIDVQVSTVAVTPTVNDVTLKVTATLLAADVRVGANIVGLTSAGRLETFAYPSQYDTPRHVGSTTLGLGTGTVTVVALGTLPVGVTTAAIAAAVGPVLDAVERQVISPVLDLLGLDAGAADVTAHLPLHCGVQTVRG